MVFWLCCGGCPGTIGRIDGVVSCYVHFVIIWQCDSEQRPHKVSFHVRKEESEYIMPTLLEKLLAKGVSTLKATCHLLVIELWRSSPIALDLSLVTCDFNHVTWADENLCLTA